MSSLFHSLVVCGAGLAVMSCGGRSQHEEPEAARGGSSNEGGSGSLTDSAGSLGSGGLLLGPVAAPPSINTAGSSSLGGATGVTIPGPLLPGAEGQWVCGRGQLTSCTTVSLEAMNVSGFLIGSACAADPTRPKSREDCTGKGRFSCLIGLFDDQAVLFNCECKTPDLSQGDCSCPASESGCYGPDRPDLCDELQAYCGCAMTCIAK